MVEADPVKVSLGVSQCPPVSTRTLTLETSTRAAATQLVADAGRGR